MRNIGDEHVICIAEVPETCCHACHAGETPCVAAGAVDFCVDFCVDEKSLLQLDQLGRRTQRRKTTDGTA